MIAALFGLVPVLEDMVLRGTDAGIIRTRAQEELVPLSALRGTMAPLALLADTEEWVAAFCSVDADSGLRRGECESVANGLQAAHAHLTNERRGPARNVLEAVLARVDAARTSRALSASEATLLGGNIRYIFGRL
jgi:hypothetical protein